MKVNNKSLALLSVALVVPAMQMQAIAVDEETARACASAFMQSHASSRLESPGSAPRLVHAEKSELGDDMTDYYVFDAGGGYVIVAGDDRAPRVLGYGEGVFDDTALPCGLTWLLNHYKKQIGYLHTHPDYCAPGRAESDTLSVGPLLTCCWGQNSPYRDRCPEINGKHCPTGCVATAMAQVMYYWQFPDALPALPAYVTSTEHLQVPALPAVEISWDDMLDVYRSGAYTSVQGDAVATLMRYCGQACFMDYSMTISTAWMGDQLTAMNKMGYDDHAVFLNRNGYSDEEWNRMMLDDLSAGHPILYVGHGDNGGHAFVIDGYSDGRYHVNWGWNGSLNGFFRLDALSPNYISSYSDAQEMVCSLYPDSSANVQFTYDFEQDGIYYESNGESVSVTRRCREFNNYEGDIVIPPVITHEGQTLAVTAIADSAFADCASLTSIVIPSTVIAIGNYAFTRCTGLNTLALPESLVMLGTGSFSYCHGLTRVEIPSSLHTVGASSFRRCINLAEVVIDDGVEGIGLSAFDDCPALERVSLGTTVKVIGENAFRKCPALTSLTIPRSVTAIKPNAFAGCRALARVKFDDCQSTTEYGCFENCSALNDLDLGHNLKSIGPHAFGHCTALTCLKIPNSVKVINYCAFYGCSALTTVELGRGVNKIGSGSFLTGGIIDSFICKAVTPPEYPTSFSSVTVQMSKLIVPRGTVDVYQATYPWNEFRNIEEADLNDDLGDVNYDGEITIADLNVLVDVIAVGNMNANHDLNGDGEVNIADINALIDLIMSR